MKHNIKITLLLLGMFFLTQFIGIFVINHYSPVIVINGNVENVTSPKTLPYGLETPPVTKPSDYTNFLYVIVTAFVLAIIFLFLLTRFKMRIIIKAWFFVVIIIALGVFFNAVLPSFRYSALIAIALAIPLAIIKVFRRNFLIHNITELLIYPGIAAVFVPILNLWSVFILLILISAYDIWAVWHSGIMQKMAKYQIDELNIFSGFFIPYVSKKLRDKIKKLKQKAKDKKKKIKVKVNLAILGGGDVIFPIISSGVVLTTGTINLPFGLPAFVGGFVPCLFVVAGATFGLAGLLLFSQKKKFYPAMPFISGGIFSMLILYYLIFNVIMH